MKSRSGERRRHDVQIPPTKCQRLASDEGGDPPPMQPCGRLVGVVLRSRWAGLLSIPGMCHCIGGPALDRFDPLPAIVGRVEKDKARKPIRQGVRRPFAAGAVRCVPIRTRLAATERGSIDDAANFPCSQSVFPAAEHDARPRQRPPRDRKAPIS